MEETHIPQDEQTADVSKELSDTSSFSAEEATSPQAKFQCKTRIPASDISYKMVKTVVNSWENDLKNIPKWKEIGGEILLRK